MFDKGDNLEQHGNGNLAIQNSEVTIILSSSQMLAQLVSERKYEEAATMLKHLIEQYSRAHPFYPHYTYSVHHNGDKTFFTHQPRSLTDAKKYPLEYTGEFKVINEGVKNSKDFEEVVHDAFLNQREIEIDLLSIRALINKYEVDTPFLEENMKDGKWVIIPKPLPDPLKVRIQLTKEKNKVELIEYAEMNIASSDKKLDTLTLDNSRQTASKLYVSLTLPRSALDLLNEETITMKNVNFNFVIREQFRNEVDGNIQFLTLLKNATLNPEYRLEFLNLQTGKVFMASKDFAPPAKTVENFDRDIEFLERLLKIEEHFNISFDLPEKYNADDYQSIEILESMIAEKPIKKECVKLTIDVKSKAIMKNLIDTFKDKAKNIGNLMFEHSGPEVQIELFGEFIPLEKIQTLYHSLKAEDINKMLRKYKDMEDGELIKFVLIPNKSNLVEEKYFPKQIKR